MQKKNKKKLGIQISKTIAVVFLIIALVYSVIIYSSEISNYKRMKDLVKLSVNSIFEQRKDEIANEIFLGHKAATGEIIAKVNEIDGVDLVSLYDKDGRIFDSTAVDKHERLDVLKHLDIASPLFEEMIIDGRKQLVYTAPIVVIGELFGFMHIHYDLESIEKEFFLQWLNFLLVLLASLALMAYVLNLKLKHLVTKPVILLISAMSKIREGELGHQVELSSDNEIGELADNFNLMSEKSRSMYEDMQALNDTLEKKVEGRTNELNRQLIETRRAQDALGESERRFRELFNNMSSGVFVLKAGSNGDSFIVKDVNYAAERIEKISKEKVTGKKLDEVFPGLDKTSLPEILKTVCKTGEALNEPAFFYQDESRTGWRRLYVYPLPGEEIVVVDDDITSEKEKEQQLDILNRELQHASLQAGMEEVASGVLHNVGNVLNSVNVSVESTRGILKGLKAEGLKRAVAMLQENVGNLDSFLKDNPKGHKLLEYLKELESHVEAGRTSSLSEMNQLQDHIEHIKEIVNMQQSYAREGAVDEIIDPQQLLEDAIRLNEASYLRHNIKLIRHFEDAGMVTAQKHKMLQIVTNLISNAKDAVLAVDEIDKKVDIHIKKVADKLEISVEDNGVGIAEENLTRIFSYGYTTKEKGHGFGLHSSAIAANEMGGRLDAFSSGKGSGAKFVLTLPLIEDNTNDS